MLLTKYVHSWEGEALHRSKDLTDLPEMRDMHLGADVWYMTVLGGIPCRIVVVIGNCC